MKKQMRDSRETLVSLSKRNSLLSLAMPAGHLAESAARKPTADNKKKEEHAQYGQSVRKRSV